MSQQTSLLSTEKWKNNLLLLEPSNKASIPAKVFHSWSKFNSLLSLVHNLDIIKLREKQCYSISQNKIPLKVGFFPPE